MMRRRACRRQLEPAYGSYPPEHQRMWQLVKQFGLIDARRTQAIVDARLTTIKRLRTLVQDGSREVPDIHDLVKANPWLIDPRWHLLGDEVNLDQFGKEARYQLDRDPNSGRDLDFMFCLGSSAKIPDEVIVVEIKRGTNPDGSLHSANQQEVLKFHNYVKRLRQLYEAAGHVPRRLHGLMIAQRYSADADGLRDTFQESSSLDVSFKSWDTVLETTEALHTEWLKVTRTRSL